ncbi:RIP metalloprotease RseP [Pelistega ratti]|uniref:RIP metalloprotease RseP n=1 Tax=Pelistega ratti TaxID=2652177 RepID=UPI00135C605C|nr:RIP metalloprotease RseP [Pelistega ratti]
MSILTFLITICIVVVFHEYGHYVAARYYNVHVERFSVGFGKVLYRRVDKKGTEWAISMLPLGGYVKPLAEPRPNHPDYQVGESVQEKTAWQKVVIYAAGPTFSFLLGIIIYTFTFMIGEQQPEAIVAEPAEHSIAANAGIRAGDKIHAINGTEIYSWSEALEALSGPMTLGQTVNMQITNKWGEQKIVNLAFPPYTGNLEHTNLTKLSGLALTTPTPIVQEVITGGPAEKAGLQVGDTIKAMNGQTIAQLADFIQMIQESIDKNITLTVSRHHQEVDLFIVPTIVTLEDGRTVARIQARFGANYPMTYVQYNPIDALIKAIDKTWDTALLSFKMIGKMIIGEVSLKNLSGPLTIADYSGKVAQHGWITFIQFIALISISIGVLNLLPIPGLDGGQMVIYSIEAIRGKALSDNLLRNIMIVGYGFLFLMMFFALSNDINRIFQ